MLAVALYIIGVMFVCGGHGAAAVGTNIRLPKTDVVWLEHGGPDRMTHVNSQPVSMAPHAALNAYAQLGYRVSHHAMSTLGGAHYTGINACTYYSWVLTKE